MTAVTINGHAYSDDGSQSRDMQGFGYRDWLLPMLSDTMTEAAAIGASVTAAAGSASDAAASATAAQNYAAALSGTSATSTTIGTGSKTLTTQTGKQFAAGQWVTVVRASDVNAWMYGQVTSYSGSTLIINVTLINGSGTYTDWTISIAGTRGATGATGAGLPSFTGADAAKLLAVNAAGTGTEWVDAAFSNVQIFTSGGTFTPVAGRSKYFVIAIGGGGGGLDSAGYSGWGGDSVLGIMTIDAAQTVTIGAGGTGGASPTAGGDTGIGSMIVAKGGANALTPSPASGGTTPSGCVRIQGGRSVGSAVGCTGGTLLHTPIETNSNVTTLPQDGHGGASTSDPYTQRDGGAGIVIIMW